MRSSEAIKISVLACEEDTKKILDEIKGAAIEGRTFLQITELKQGTVSKLQSLGYEVSPTSVYGSETPIYYIIKWSGTPYYDLPF